MKETHLEIITALSKCSFIPGSIDKRTVMRWVSYIQANNRPLEQNDEGHMYKLLYKYRGQCVAVYNKHIDHPYCKPRK